MTRATAQRHTARLMTKKDAAGYLGYKSTWILEKLGIKPISIATVGGSSREMYDRRVIDLYLDRLSGIQNIGESAELEKEDPDEAYRRWDQGRTAHAA